MTKITIDELKTKSKEQAKKYITKKFNDFQISKIYQATETKSKVRDYICNKTRKTMIYDQNDHAELIKRTTISILSIMLGTVTLQRDLLGHHWAIYLLFSVQ
jgi:hypothetical protein